MASKAAVVVLIPSTGEIGGPSTGWASSGQATRKLHGLTDQSFTVVENVEAVPLVGYYGPSPIADRVSQYGEFSMEGVWTYQEAPKFLNGFFTYTSQSTGADPYPLYWSAPVASTQQNATYALEFGTTGASYRAHGCVFNELSISGEAGGNWRFTIGGFSKDIATTTGLTTGANADSRTVKPVAMADTHLRIDDFSSGIVGSSSGQVDATLISFELTFNPNRHGKLFAGSQQYGAWGDARNEATLRTLLEFNATNKAYIDSMIPSSTSATSTGAILERLVSIYASATSSSYLSVIDFAGVVASPIKMWDDRDGNLTVDITWTGKFTTQFDIPGTSGGNYLAFLTQTTASGTS